MVERRILPDTRGAKLFRNGASQAVRLPADFRFEGDAVYATRDEQTGDLILSNHPGASTWSAFFEFLRAAPVPNDFLDERPMNTRHFERIEAPLMMVNWMVA